MCFGVGLLSAPFSFPHGDHHQIRGGRRRGRRGRRFAVQYHSTAVRESSRRTSDCSSRRAFGRRSTPKHTTTRESLSLLF